MKSTATPPMKKSSKGASTRAIRTLSRKENPLELKRNIGSDAHPQHNNSAFLPVGQHDRANSLIPRGVY